METIAAFSNHLPVEIRFGEGVVAELAALAGRHRAGRVVAIVDDGLERALPAAAAALEAIAGTVDRHVKPAGEPTGATVDAAAAAIGDDAGLIVAIGGGSVIDTAKAARLCAQTRLGFAGLVDAGPRYEEPRVPLVAVPTTAGTGSEVSGGAVVTDAATGRKAGIAHPTLRAQHALVDPQLTWSLPPATTAHAGFDALAQAIAAIVARCRTPIGDAIALEATRLIGAALPRAYRDGGDRTARAAMACGSLMAGLAMNISDCSAEHSLAQALGGEYHLPHGLTVGLVFAETLERERAHVPERLERVAAVLGLPDDGSGDGSRLVRWIRALLAELDFPVLSAVGVTAADLDRLSALAAADHFITQAPVPWTGEEIRQAFARALALTAR